MSDEIVKKIGKSVPKRMRKTTEEIIVSQSKSAARVELKAALAEKGFESVDSFLVSLLKKVK